MNDEGRLVRPAKPKLIVPAPSEADGYPMTELVMDSVVQKLMINEEDHRAVAERLAAFRAGGEDYLHFIDLFGEEQHLTQHAASKVLLVGRAFARHVPARSQYFDIARPS